jgi:hypothetical protein
MIPVPPMKRTFMPFTVQGRIHSGKSNETGVAAGLVEAGLGWAADEDASVAAAATRPKCFFTGGQDVSCGRDCIDTACLRVLVG